MNYARVNDDTATLNLKRPSVAADKRDEKAVKTVKENIVGRLSRKRARKGVREERREGDGVSRSRKR